MSPTRQKKVALFIETSNAYARGILEGIEEYSRVNGPWNFHLAEHSRGERPPDWLMHWKGDGMIARIENKRIATDLGRVKIPLVDVSNPRCLPEVPTVTTDNSIIARLALQHFLERGFRHFGFCGDSRFPWSTSRGQHFSRFVRDSGSQCHEYESSNQLTDSDAETDSIARWLLCLPQPVAIFACYDYRGQQVLDACRRVGLAVPEQVAVMGVDNDELLCRLSPPPLSSVIPNTRRAGWIAAELLAQMMNGESVPALPHFVPPIGLAARHSTDTLAVDDPQIAKALRFIREHACAGIGVADVLRHCPMARRSFESRLKAIVGRTPKEEITRVQLQRVKELLNGTDLSLAEIAGRTGFKHVEYLTVVFKRECGQPPSAYRQEQQPKR